MKWVIARLDARTVVAWRSNQGDTTDATMTAKRAMLTIRMMRPHIMSLFWIHVAFPDMRCNLRIGPVDHSKVRQAGTAERGQVYSQTESCQVES